MKFVALRVRPNYAEPGRDRDAHEAPGEAVLRKLHAIAHAFFRFNKPVGAGQPRVRSRQRVIRTKRTGGALALRQRGRREGWDLGIRKWSLGGMGLSPEDIPRFQSCFS